MLEDLKVVIHGSLNDAISQVHACEDSDYQLKGFNIFNPEKVNQLDTGHYETIYVIVAYYYELSTNKNIKCIFDVVGEELIEN